MLGADALDDPAEDAGSESLQDVAEIGAIVSSLGFGQGLVSGAREGLGQVGGEHLGMEVLADGFGQFAAELFDAQAMLEDFVAFFDAPPFVIELGKLGGGKGDGVGEGGGEDLDPAVGQDHANQAESEGLEVQFGAGGLGLLASPGGDGTLNDALRLAGTGEGFDLGPLGVVDAGQEGDAPLQQPRRTTRSPESRGP